MTEIINLRIARKRAKREAASAEAAKRRAAYGRPKADQALDRARSEKARNDLEGHRLDKGDGR